MISFTILVLFGFLGVPFAQGAVLPEEGMHEAGPRARTMSQMGRDGPVPEIRGGC